MRAIFTVTAAVAALSFSQIALSQVDIRGRGVTGDINNSQTIGSGNSTTQQQGTANQGTTQSGSDNQATQQSGTGNKSTTDSSTGTSSSGSGTSGSSASGAGPTDNPNVTRDAKGREHTNKGKHKGWAKGHDNKGDSNKIESAVA